MVTRGLPRDRAGRHGNHHCPPLGDGDGNSHRATDGSGRRAGSRLGAGPGGAGPRRPEVWRPEYRRFKIDPRFLCGVPPGGSDGAADARTGCRDEVGGAGGRVPGPQPPGRRHRRPGARFRRTGGAGQETAGSGGDGTAAEEPRRIPLHRQGGADRRSGRHLHRPGGLRHRRPAAGDGPCLHRAVAGPWRPAQVP